MKVLEKIVWTTTKKKVNEKELYSSELITECFMFLRSI